MIVTIPERTSHIELQPPVPFRFLWDVFFGNRKRLKLTQEDVADLELKEQTTRPWEVACEQLNGFRMNPDSAFHQAIADVLANPTQANVEAVLSARWVPPYSGMQLGQATEQLTGLIQAKLAELIGPAVRRHLKRIHSELEKEIAEQKTADAKALSRLGDGTAQGGQSDAVRVLRDRLGHVARSLEGADTSLANWREHLGAFLP